MFDAGTQDEPVAVVFLVCVVQGIQSRKSFFLGVLSDKGSLF